MKYYEKLDGLRFVAIFLVLLDHFAPIFGEPISAGFYGVDLFFVISGFLITSILLKPNNKTFKVNYKNFIGRRTLRIFPIYYLSILIFGLLNLPIVRAKLFWLISYTFNYALVFYDIPINAISHLWSLCVEEQFYLFWPLVILSLKNNQKELTILIIAIIALAYAQFIYNIFPSLSPYNYVGLLTRMGSLGLGALGATLSVQNILPEKLFKNKFLEYFVFLVLAFSMVLNNRFKPLILGLCSFYIVAKAANYDFYIAIINKFLKNKYVIYIGTLAYGIYVFHGPITYYFQMYIFEPFWHWLFHFKSLGILGKLEWHSWIIKFPLYSFLSIIVAWTSFNFIEKPILRLKDKYFRY